MAKFFIHRPVFAIVISLVILIAGGLSILTLPVAQFPEISPPTIQVAVVYPGANAKTVEESVAIPLEQQINGAENMIYFSSQCSSDGRYVLTCTFAVGTNLDMANVDINNRVARAQSQLPPDAVAYGITVSKMSPNMLMVVSVYSPDNSYDSTFLSNYCSLNLIDSITRTPGVGSTSLVGQRDYSMRLWVRPDRMAKLGLTAGDIAGVVQEQNTLAPAGSVGQPPAKPGLDFQYTVNVQGRLTTAEEFGNLIVRTNPDGSMLRMKDVARVEMAAKDYSSYGRMDGVPCTVILIYQLPGSNAIDTANRLHKLLEEMGAKMPPGLKYKVIMDSTEFVRVSIEEVLEALRDAIILVLIVVFVFLGNFRATLIPMLAVPVSLVGTFAAFQALGFSINTLTLFGIVLAVGIVVDDAIVVVEAVEHHIEQGLDPTRATEKAMDEVSGPVVAIALVLTAVFVPVAFMGGITGQLYKQFAMTLSVSVLLSALVALTLTPALCRLILRHRREMRGPLGAFLRGFNRLFDAVTRGYTSAVRLILRRGVVFVLILLAFWAGAAWLLNKLPAGFVPDEDQGYFFVSMSLPDGASLERTEALSKKAESFVRKVPGVESVLTMGGLNILTGSYTSNNATLILRLKSWDERKTPETQIKSILGAIQLELLKYPEAQSIAFIPPSIPGLGNAGGFQFELEDRGGHSTDELMETARNFIAEASQRPELTRLYTGFSTSVPQIDLQVDREKARTIGVPINQVFQALQIFLGSMQVNDFNRFSRTYKVMIQAEADFRATPENIRQIYVRSDSGNMVPLSTLTKVTDIVGPNLIQRFNMFRMADISGGNSSAFSSGQALDALEETARAKLPPGYGFEWTGVAYQEKEAGGSQSMIFALALVFVFLFLAAQYESWAIPFSVLLGLPLGIFGSFLMIWLVGLINDTFVQIGLVMLIGLAAKNAILIVEFAKERYEQGMPLLEAAVEGSRLRFRPILMTSFAFILGVLPLVLASGAGSGSRVSLGSAVFGGMTAATSLGVFFIPLLYVLVTRLAGGRRKAPAGEGAKPEGPAAEGGAS